MNELAELAKRVEQLERKANDQEHRLNNSVNQTIAVVAGALLGGGQFSDNQIGPAIQRAVAIVKQAGL